MNFNKRDIAIIVSMSIAVILMTFTFSALGLSDNTVSQSEIPEFNSSANNFQMTGDFPDSPGTPSNFNLKWNKQLQSDSENRVWLKGDTSNGYEVFVTNTSGNPEIWLNNWTNGNAVASQVTLNNEGDYAILENDYKLYIEWEETRNVNTTSETWIINVQIRSAPGDTGIAFLDGIFGTGEAIAQTVTYIGVLIWWFSATLLEIVINLILTLYNVMAFFVSFLHFLITSYTGIITGVPSWVSLILGIPGILLSLEFSKLILIGIKLLPTT